MAAKPSTVLPQPHTLSSSTAPKISQEIDPVFINVDRAERGRIICTVSVKPPICNIFDTLHGGGLASVAELISIACARTVVAEDKQIFLGEISMSYLSGAPVTAEVTADASVVKSGRNLTVVELEFKLKKTEKLIYKAHATFYNYPLARL
ncbi:hypothetical protein K1719_002557 [Acacia pycnantha]|nr:hypothetical protein K1719_002557 [Acacia pycnantha]